MPFRARARGEIPPRRLQSLRRNWCEGSGLASPAAQLRPRARPGFARRGSVCGKPGICMKPLDPTEQRRQRRTPAAAAAARGRSRAARVSGPRWMRGWGAAHGPELRLPGAAGRGAGGAAEARGRRRRRKRRRTRARGPGKQAEQRRRRRSPGLAMLLASAVVVWEWLNEHGRWRPYSPAVSHHIEAVVRAGPRAGGSVVLGQVDSRLAPYIIDLQSMNQFRQDTGEPAPLPHPRPLPLPALGSPASRAPRDPPNPQVRAVCHREVVVEGALYSPPSSYNPPAINVPASTIRVLVMQREPQASP